MSELEALIGIVSSSLGVLLPAAKLVQLMMESYGRVKFARKRCKAVILRAAFVVKQVHQSLNDSNISTSSNIKELEKKFQDIQIIIERFASMSFFKALLRFDDIDFELDAADRHVTDCLQLFQIDLLSRAQAEKEQAAKLDREFLQGILKSIAGNYEEIRRLLGLRNAEDEDQAMAVMERKLTKTKITSHETVEMQVIQKSLEGVKASTGRSAPKQNKWLITKYDLDDCGIIGGGGFSTVSKAKFRGVTVAVKTLKEFENANLKEALEKEINIWSGLRHDHIVPFYGASTLTHPPYIVSRYMSNGNLNQYLAKNTKADRMKLTFEVSLGMLHLHEEQIIHGDLKGVNVLVDDSGKACITDFGLSKICASGAAGIAGTGKISGTLRFLAPEALEGHPLTFETDIYAFGMLIYEVFAGEVPFIRETDEKVREGSLKLDYPKSSQARENGFNDALWDLLTECISPTPSMRPRFQAIQARLHSLRKPEPPSLTIRSDLADEHATLWTFDVGETCSSAPATLTNTDSLTPLVKEGELSRAQTSFSSLGSIMHDIKSIPPVCIEVTLKHYGVKFGISSREPGVHLDEDGYIAWQPIKPAKRSLLRIEHNHYFTFRSHIGEESSSWDLAGNEAILRTPSIKRAVCHFDDAETANKWFALQLSIASNGTLGDWGTSNVTGDWHKTVQSWRRFERGKIQKAALVEGVATLVPSNGAWTSADFPKRLKVDNSSGAVNCIVFTTNPGTTQPGKFCCKLEGCKVIFETYRRKHDIRPITAREELYPSEEGAQAMFQVLGTILRKVKAKHGILHF